jgi:hypothetical protein
MAGFQKFPVPKYLFIDFWNYNKKWLGNTIATVSGAFLFFLSFNRFAMNRHVMNLLIYILIEIKLRIRKLYRSTTLTRTNYC